MDLCEVVAICSSAFRGRAMGVLSTGESGNYSLRKSQKQSFPTSNQKKRAVLAWEPILSNDTLILVQLILREMIVYFLIQSE